METTLQSSDGSSTNSSKDHPMCEYCDIIRWDPNFVAHDEKREAPTEKVIDGVTHWTTAKGVLLCGG